MRGEGRPEQPKVDMPSVTDGVRMAGKQPDSQTKILFWINHLKEIRLMFLFMYENDREEENKDKRTKQSNHLYHPVLLFFYGHQSCSS